LYFFYVFPPIDKAIVTKTVPNCGCLTRLRFSTKILPSFVFPDPRSVAAEVRFPSREQINKKLECGVSAIYYQITQVVTMVRSRGILSS